MQNGYGRYSEGKRSSPVPYFFQFQARCRGEETDGSRSGEVHIAEKVEHAEGWGREVLGKIVGGYGSRRRGECTSLCKTLLTLS